MTLSSTRETVSCALPCASASQSTLTAPPDVVRTDLKTCGKVPLKITKQPAKVRYLSECKWGYSTSDESMKFYGRDLDVTLTCWTEGGEVLNNP